MPVNAAKTPAQELLDANMAIMTTVIEAGHKAQTRSLNLTKVLVEGAGRQQEKGQKVFAQLTDTALPWYSPERFKAIVGMLSENQNEVLRLGREYIGELNAAAAESRETMESLVKQAGKSRDAQQAIYGEGLAGFRSFASAAAPQTAKA